MADTLLLPCPFCGNTVQEQPNFGFPFIECKECSFIFDGGIPEAIRYEDFETARLKWNTRVGNMKLIETVEVLQEMVDMMNSGDEHGTGSDWHRRAVATLSKSD